MSDSSAPRRLTIDPALDAETRRWVRAAIRVEMARNNLGYRDLADRLREAGVDENERNIANKVARGELSAATFLLCLKVLGCETLILTGWETNLNEVIVLDAQKISEALEDELVTVVERDDDAGVYRFRVGSLTTPITAVLIRKRSTSVVAYTVSHVLALPDEIKERPRTSFASSTEVALNSIIFGLASAYKKAVEKGLHPNESWLIPSNSLPRLVRKDVKGASNGS